MLGYDRLEGFVGTLGRKERREGRKEGERKKEGTMFLKRKKERKKNT